MRKLRLFTLIGLMLMLASCDVLQQAAQQAMKGGGAGGGPLTEAQIVNGLKEALRVGTNNGVQTLSRRNGFFGNARFKIPFPPEVQRVETTLRSIGMGNMVDDFILKLNRGAEEAVKEATPIFVNAITSMSIADGRNILFGGDRAATDYFRGRTTTQLTNAFMPRVRNVLDNKVQVTQAWNELATAYNRVPGVQPATTDLPRYVTDKAIQALFIRIGEEEKKIRENPSARVNNVLRSVFGELDKR